MRAIGSIVVFVMCAALSACVTTTDGARPPTDADAAAANLNLGVNYLQQGRPDAAIAALERAIDLEPRSADAHSALALAYDQYGEPDRAEEHHRRATQLDVNNSAAQNSFGVFLCRQNRWSEAERYFERAVSNPRYPTPAAARTNAANCALGAGDLVKAEENFRTALALEPAYPDALSGMLELAVRNENYLQARAFVQRSFAADLPANPRLLWLCTYVEHQLGDTGASENCAQQLRSRFPNSPEVAQLRELERNAGS
jgi:type IV pilus assembly protein PilF